MSAFTVSMAGAFRLPHFTGSVSSFRVTPIFRRCRHGRLRPLVAWDPLTIHLKNISLRIFHISAEAGEGGVGGGLEAYPSPRV